LATTEYSKFLRIIFSLVKEKSINLPFLRIFNKTIVPAGPLIKEVAFTNEICLSTTVSFICTILSPQRSHAFSAGEFFIGETITSSHGTTIST
jgi:hypothetical protein